MTFTPLLLMLMAKLQLLIFIQALVMQLYPQLLLVSARNLSDVYMVEVQVNNGIIL